MLLLLSLQSQLPAWAVGAAAPAGEPAAAATTPSRVSGVRIELDGDTTRLIFALSTPVPATAFVLADPDRAVIDLPQVDFALDPEIGQAASEPIQRAARRGSARRAAPSAARPLGGAIASFRFGLFAPSRSRIVIDLAAPSRIVKVDSETGAGGPELVIELAGTNAASFAAAAAAAAQLAAAVTPPPSPVAPPAAGDSDKPVIVIDPGHGGIDPGAHGAVGDEKDIVFAFAQVLVAKLEAEGRYRIIMTRTSDVFVSLAERVRIAEDSHAALFISLHADTISDASGVSGATIYTASTKASDSDAARVAAEENAADAAGGLVAAKPQNSDVSDILADLTRRETRTFSHDFSHTLANYWQVVAALNKNPERSAGFVVLTAPDVPSVLLELGYLSNAKDSRSLIDPAWRDRATTALQHSIDTFFASRPAPAAAPVVEGDAAVAADPAEVAPALH